MHSQDLKQLKKIANDLKSQFNLGKTGINKAFTEQIDKYLKVHGIVKIKDLSSASKNDTAGKADRLAKQLNAIILSKKGFTFVLYREE